MDLLRGNPCIIISRSPPIFSEVSHYAVENSMMAYYGESEREIFICPALSVTMRMTIFPVQETCWGGVYYSWDSLTV